MTNIDFIGIGAIIKDIPNYKENAKYRILEEQETVKKGDLIAMVSIISMQDKTCKITWAEPDQKEIGKQRKYSGQVVIREIIEPI